MPLLCRHGREEGAEVGQNSPPLGGVAGLVALDEVIDDLAHPLLLLGGAGLAPSTHAKRSYLLCGETRY